MKNPTQWVAWWWQCTQWSAWGLQRYSWRANGAKIRWRFNPRVQCLKKQLLNSASWKCLKEVKNMQSSIPKLLWIVKALIVKNNWRYQYHAQRQNNFNNVKMGINNFSAPKSLKSEYRQVSNYSKGSEIMFSALVSSVTIFQGGLCL